jgi:hypothetical protein
MQLPACQARGDALRTNDDRDVRRRQFVTARLTSARSMSASWKSSGFKWAYRSVASTVE